MAKKVNDDETRIFKSNFLTDIATFITFVCTLFTVPWLVLCYICVQTSRKFWLKILANRFPHLNFIETTSIRTLLDNHRNQGVINVLMAIKGPCQPEFIRQAVIEHLLEKKDKAGNIFFPKLRAGLVSCWGNYAWSTNIPFKLENHLIMGKPQFRGRPITEQNIQDYVNDIVTKYLPSNLPPWQVIIIPNITSNEEKYCVLTRVHHLLIDDDEPLKIGDFLLLKSERRDSISAECSTPADNTSCMSEDLAKTPLSDIIPKPKTLPKLCSMLSDSLSNRWNEFISEFDPLESPKVMKSSLGYFQCMAVFLIAFVSVCKEFRKTLNLQRKDPANSIRLFISTLYREISRRGITIVILLQSCLISFNPVIVLRRTLKCLYWTFFFCSITLPSLMIRELVFLLRDRKYYIYQNTAISVILSYFPLLYSALNECVDILQMIYKAPINLITELIFNDDNEERHHLQTVSLCGRKVVAWSPQISRKALGEAAAAVGVSETEILLTMTGNCLREYFQCANLKVPKSTLITARTVSCDTLLSSTEKNGDFKLNKGIVCISLPINENGDGNPIDEVLEMNKRIKNIRRKQGVLYALGGEHALIVKGLPTVLARIFLNYWTRKYSVTLTEVAESGSGGLRHSQWGHTVLSLVAWRPPQGNISMSLTIQRYANHVRIGIMADAQLAPHHTVLADYWSEAAHHITDSLQKRLEIES